MVVAVVGLVDIGVPPGVVGPWCVPDEVDEGVDIVEFILDGGAGEAPIDLAS